jgi:hypothetical protein
MTKAIKCKKTEKILYNVEITDNPIRFNPGSTKGIV